MSDKGFKILVGNFKRRFQYREAYVKWRLRGKPLPPPHFVKQLAIQKYRKKSHFDILIESGTYLGEMVEAQRRHFSKIVSIELSQTLFEQARDKFQKCANIEILHGDSGESMNEIVAHLNSPAIFWLDGHYSGGSTAKGKSDTPILDELVPIFQSSLDHVILIDDARLFVGSDGYPSIAFLEDLADKAGYSLTVQDDIIRLESKQSEGRTRSNSSNSRSGENGKES